MKNLQTVDVKVLFAGSITVVKPLSEEADEWIVDNIGGDPLWWFGGLVVEPRYLEEILSGMIADGLEVA